MNPFSNYTGMYLSDGKFQPSVAYGKQRPTSELDKFSRFHDTMYSLYSTRKKRRAADLWYHDNVPDDWLSQLAGDVVWYGNRMLNAPLHPIDELSGSVDPRDVDIVKEVPKNDPMKGVAGFSPVAASPTLDNSLLFIPGSGLTVDRNYTDSSLTHAFDSSSTLQNPIDLSFFSR